MPKDILSGKEREFLEYERGKKPKIEISIDSGHFYTYRDRIEKKLQDFPYDFDETVTDLIRLDGAGYLSGQLLTDKELDRRRRWLTLYEASNDPEYLNDLSERDREVIREIGESETDLEWWDAWIKLLDAGRRDRHIRMNWSRHEGERPNRAIRPPPYRIDGYGLGKRVGKTITRLAPNEDELDRIRTDAVAGFIDGVSMGVNAEGWEQLSEEIGERLDDRADEVSGDETDREQSREAHTKASRKANERIHAAIPDDVDTSEWLVWWIRECIKPKTRMRSTGSTDFSYPEKAEPDTIQSILDEYRLAAKQRLKLNVEADIERLESSTSRGISSSWLDVLEEIQDHDGEPLSKDVADRLEGNVHHGKVTEAANHLTGNEWASPLLSRNEKRWKITQYGRVIGETTQKNMLETWYDFDPRSPNESWINSELIETTLEEMD